MGELDGFVNRLRGIVEPSANAFAAKAGMSEGALRSYLSGTIPRADKILQIAKAANVSAGWLLTGTENTRPSDNPVMGLIEIPRFDISASAGPGLIPSNPDDVEHLGLSETWLRSLGFQPPSIAAITIEGDSMTKPDGTGIPPGAMGLVDTAIGEEDIRTGLVYVIVREDELLVKRIERRLDGTLILHSDNPRYGSEQIPADMMPRIHIAGRVRWVGFGV